MMEVELADPQEELFKDTTIVLNFYAEIFNYAHQDIVEDKHERPLVYLRVSPMFVYEFSYSLY